MTFNLKESKIHKLLIDNLNIPPSVALSLLNFIYEVNGHIAGSASLSMYLSQINMSSFTVNDLDIYIPCTENKTTRYATASRNLILENTIDMSQVNILDIAEYGNNTDWIVILNKFKSYFCDYLGIYKMSPEIKENYSGNSTTSTMPWSKIVDFNQINERTRLRLRQVAAGNTPDIDLPDIQLIFVDINTDIKSLIDCNYDFHAVKVMTTLNKDMPLEAIDDFFVKNKLLNVPDNLSSITLVACFKTVIGRIFKYTKRGFIPHNFVTNKDFDLITSYKRFLKLLKLYLFEKIIKEIDNKFAKGKVAQNVTKIEGSFNDLTKHITTVFRDVATNPNFLDEISDTYILSHKQTAFKKKSHLNPNDKLELIEIFKTFILEIKSIVDKYYNFIILKTLVFHERKNRNRRFYNQGSPLRDRGLNTNRFDVSKLSSEELGLDKNDDEFLKYEIRNSDFIRNIRNELRQLQTLRGNEKSYVRKCLSNKDPSIPDEPIKNIVSYLPKYGGKLKPKN